ncbi:peptide deformylase [candidate division KSB1 bacterium]|nr:peptide deformylase [candidate division KSB1 bacterium]
MQTQTDIIRYPHPVLLKTAAPVENINQQVIDTLDIMTRMLKYHEGVGLAAPQIKISQRLITVYVKNALYQMINPVIKWESVSEKGIEGCLSVPEKYYEVVRAQEIIVQGFTPDQNDVTILADGILARVFQHEIDHLNGILINIDGIRVEIT